jgi:hypothetical protein
VPGRQRKPGANEPPPKRPRGSSPIGHDPNRMTPQKVKVASGGNSLADQEWIKEIGDDILEFESQPAVPWDVKYQFQGYASEVEPGFFLDLRTRKTKPCTGTSWIRDDRGGYILDLDFIRLQRPCLASPILGGNVCPKHGGQLAHVKEAAQLVLAQAAEKAADTLITLTSPRDELNEIVDQKVRVSAANSVLDRVGIKGGSTVEVQVPGYEKVLAKMFSDGEED